MSSATIPAWQDAGRVLIVARIRLPGLRTVGMKAVASGCRADAPDRGNEDAAALIAASNFCVPIDLIYPHCFAPAIAPHLAAQQAGSSISLPRIRKCYLSLASLAERVAVEGVGGLFVPLCPQGRVDRVSNPPSWLAVC